MAARQEESTFSGGLANPQCGVSSCSSPAPLLHSFSSANSVMLLPKGKPKIHGQEDELQWQRSCFVFDCSKWPCQALSFFPPATSEARTYFCAAWRSQESCPGRRVEVLTTQPSPDKCGGSVRKAGPGHAAQSRMSGTGQRRMGAAPMRGTSREQDPVLAVFSSHFSCLPALTSCGFSS